jgi:hypothetical protein
MKTGLVAIVAFAITFPAWSADAPAARLPPSPRPSRSWRSFAMILQAKSADVMAKALTLTPTGDEVLALLQGVSEGAVGDRRRQIKATQKYAKNFEHLSDADAVEFINALLTRDQKTHDLRVKWLAKFQTVVPPVTAARAIQVERRLGLVSQIGVSSQIPLVR